jgi:hypothetical protein
MFQRGVCILHFDDYIVRLLQSSFQCFLYFFRCLQLQERLRVFREQGRDQVNESLRDCVCTEGERRKARFYKLWRKLLQAESWWEKDPFPY